FGLLMSGLLFEESNRSVVATQCQLLMIGPNGECEYRFGLLGVYDAFDHSAGIPPFDRAIRAQGVERFAVCAIGQPANGAFMGKNRLNDLSPFCRDLPNANAFVDSPSSQTCAIPAPGDGIEPVGGFAQRIEARAGTH